MSTANEKKLTPDQIIMMTINQIVYALRDRNIQQVARESGVSANAIYRLLQGGTRPLHDTVVRLSNYLSGTQPDDK